MSRIATITRKTSETAVSVSVDIDGTGSSKIATGIGFFNHMLEQLARHSLIDIELNAQGDLHIDDHHTVEDCGIALGQAIAKALGERRGIRRYASFDLVMDEACSRASLDVSGRAFLVWQVNFTANKIGNFDSELIREFFQALVHHSGITLHMVSAAGVNNHHIAESSFKAFARALRSALELDPRDSFAIPSTKGVLI